MSEADCYKLILCKSCQLLAFLAISGLLSGFSAVVIVSYLLQLAFFVLAISLALASDNVKLDDLITSPSKRMVEEEQKKEQ